MSQDPDIAELETPRLDPDALRGPDDQLNPAWVERLRDWLHSGDKPKLEELTAPLHAADMGDLLEAITAEERVQLVTLLGDKFDFSALTEVDDTVRSALIEAINDYPGATIIVSHDRHLLDACADRLWLVADGRVTPFDGDLDDFISAGIRWRKRKEED